MNIPSRHRIVPLAAVILAASLGLSGCGGDAQPDVDESTPEPSATEPEVPVAYDCPIEGYSIPSITLGGASDIGGNGLEYVAMCFTLESPATVDALAYPISGDQAQAVSLYRLDPELDTVLSYIVDPYRVDESAGEIHGEGFVLGAGAYGKLPYLSKDLDPGTYLAVTYPTFDTELVPTRLAVYSDGGDHYGEYLAAENPWVVEQATRGGATCSPPGHNIGVLPFGWSPSSHAKEKEWMLLCFALDEPTTVTIMAYPISTEQDLHLEILALTPGGLTTDQEVFDWYRWDSTAPVVTFDSVWSANDEIGVLPWGMVDLPAGQYVVVVSSIEAVPLDSNRIRLSRDGKDHLEDFFGESENPWVVAQYDAYVSGN